MKRFCKSPHCDVMTMHNGVFSDAGLPVWKCQNCGAETPRQYRMSAKRKALNEELRKLENDHDPGSHVSRD